MPEKAFCYSINGEVEYKNSMLFRGLDDILWLRIPHTTIHRKDVEAVPELQVLASSEEAGVYVIKTTGK